MAFFNIKGIAYDNLTTTERNALSSPPIGLVIYNSTTGQLQVNTGTPSVPVWTAASGGIPTPFVEEKTSIAGSNAGAWVNRSLGAGYANKIIEAIIEGTSNSNKAVGVRAIGSSFDLSFTLRRGQAYRQVLADASGDIQIFSNSNDGSFWIIGTK
jgi:hypothetical protein